MGGGAGRGAGMLRSLRTFQRSVNKTSGGGDGGGEIQDPFSQSNTTHNNNNTFSNNPKTRPTTYTNSTTLFLSSSSTAANFPLSAVPTWLSSCDDEFEWECINGTEDDDFVFGTVPSKDEAHHAVSALQQVLRPVYFSDTDGEFPSSDSELGWIEPSLHLCINNSTQLLPHSTGSDSVHEAFRLLQTEPSVQNGGSLSSDKAVWDAVLNNQVVRELRGSLYEGGSAENSSITTGSKDEDGSTSSNAAMEILSRIFFNTRTKVVELIEKITEMVCNLFRRPQTIEGRTSITTTTTGPFEKKLRTSFLLSVAVVVFLVVAVSISKSFTTHTFII